MKWQRYYRLFKKWIIPVLMRDNRCFRNIVRIARTQPTPVLPFRPYKISLYVSSRCNLSCNMCGYHKPGEYETHQYPDMDLKRFEHIISFFPECCHLTLTAEGEPFLNKDIFKMLVSAKKKGFYVDTSTNGVALSDLCEEIIASPLDLLNISIDGVDYDDFLMIRGGTKTQYEQMMSSAKKLCTLKKQRKSPMVINGSFIVTASNYMRMPDMLRCAIALGVDGVTFQNSMFFNAEFSNEHRPIYDTDTEIISFIKNLDIPQELKSVVLPVIFNSRNAKDTPNRFCIYPFNTVGVNTNGNINPCCYVNTRKEYGNIFTEFDFWNNQSYQSVRSAFLDGKLAFKLCETCPVQGLVMKR